MLYLVVGLRRVTAWGSPESGSSRYVYADSFTGIFHCKDRVRLDKSVCWTAVPARDEACGFGAKLMHGFADQLRAFGQARSYSVVSNVLANFLIFKDN